MASMMKKNKDTQNIPIIFITASNKINTAYDNKCDFVRSLSYKMFNTEKSMYIKSLKLQNFRNYAEESFAFDPAVNLICGENGQGKTNLLEAAAACSTMRLFRTAQKKEGLRFGENHAFIFADFVAQERDISLELRFSRTKAMEIYKNGVRQKRQSDTQG